MTRKPVVPPSDDAVWSVAKPLLRHDGDLDLYAGFKDATYAFDRGCYRLHAGGSVKFDRIMNLFAFKKWKALTDVADLRLAVTYSGGAASVRVVTHDGAKPRPICSFPLEAATALRVASFPLPAGTGADLISLHIDAEVAVDLFDISFISAQPRRSEVRLGIVITTFNRPDDVEAQAAMLEGLALRGVSYRVLLVDNGRNLEMARTYLNTRCIPSPNLGGAGGFTRGLAEIVEDGGFTHAMFMDDDAFCHPEAIVRAVNLLRYSKTSRLALSGAMNYTHAPQIQYELGGKIADYGVRSIRMDVEVNSAQAAQENQVAETPAYGAWWGFIFPLDCVDVLPFPFFVRGDDVAFSLQNRFKLETLPGLIAWQPSFAFKISAPIEYLAHRSFLALPLVVAGRWKKADVLTGVRHAFDLEVDGLRYPIAEGICDALEDVLTGPAFWNNAGNTLARVQRLGRLEQAFSKRSFLPDWIYKGGDGEARRSMRVLRARFGHINLPARLCWRRPLLTNDMIARKGQAAFRRGIIYHSPDDSRSLSCVRDWRWRRRLDRRFRGLVDEYDRRFDDLATDYARGQVHLQSMSAWKARFAGQIPEPALAHTSL